MDTRHKELEPPVSSNHLILRIVFFYAFSFIVFGFVVASPGEIGDGLMKIFTTRDALITDYIGVGGMGAAFFNAGMLTCLACAIYRITGASISGASIASLLTLMGFGLFGKSLLNVWPIVVGVWLYARFKKERFATYLNTAFFGCALAPIFTEVLYSSTITRNGSVPLAFVTALAIGFILPPAAAQLFRAHDGYNLYNIGYTAGIVGTVVVALYKSYGFVPDPVMIWTSEREDLLSNILIVMFLSMVLVGLFLDHRSVFQLSSLSKLSGQAPADFVAMVGLGPTMVNMGLCGLVSLAYLLVIGADLNGPTIGSILMVVGFGAFGKHPLNIMPVMAGVYLGALAKPWGATDPSTVLAAFFGTTLAPIAGEFGWFWGIVAGFLHSSVVRTVGFNHGALNLYNNGFSAGIVASVLVPVIVALQQKRSEDSP